MTTNNHYDVDILQIQREVQEYKYRLNTTVGLYAVITAIGCLGTDHPSIHAALVFVMTMFVAPRVQNSIFPRTIAAVNELLIKYPNDQYLVKLKSQINGNILSLRSAGLSILPYFFGCSFFFFVMIIELLQLDPQLKSVCDWYLN